MALDKHVIIVGGGPVGMYLSILLSKYVKKIIIVEKRSLPFTRNQIVVFDINKISINLRREILSKLKQKGVCFVDPPALTLGLTCYPEGKPLIACPLNILESVLNDIIKKYHNIFIMRNTKILKINYRVNNISIQEKNGEEKLLKYNILIGSDGKNSMVKKTFAEHFNETFIISLDDNVYGAIFTFKVNPIRLVNKHKSFLTNFLHKRARIFQHKSGVVYVGLAVSREEYNEIKDHEDTNKMRDIKDNQVPQVVFDYLKINDVILTEKDLLCVNVFKNRVSYCNTCCYKYNNNLHFIIGDACFNVHFFTGSALNAHFGACHELIRSLKLNYNNCHKDNYYRNFISLNKIKSLEYTLKFNKNDIDANEVSKKAKKLGIHNKIIKSLSIKELFYLVNII